MKLHLIFLIRQRGVILHSVEGHYLRTFVPLRSAVLVHI
jgi:hypothetical protein